MSDDTRKPDDLGTVTVYPERGVITWSARQGRDRPDLVDLGRPFTRAELISVVEEELAKLTAEGGWKFWRTPEEGEDGTMIYRADRPAQD